MGRTKGDGTAAKLQISGAGEGIAGIEGAVVVEVQRGGGRDVVGAGVGAAEVHHQRAVGEIDDAAGQVVKAIEGAGIEIERACAGLVDGAGIGDRLGAGHVLLKRTGAAEVDDAANEVVEVAAAVKHQTARADVDRAAVVPGLAGHGAGAKRGHARSVECARAGDGAASPVKRP